MKNNSRKNHTPTSKAADKRDNVIASVITSLTSLLEKGVNPWVKPWDADGRPTSDADYFAVNYVTRQPYGGINQAILEPGYYVTFKQALELGATVGKNKGKPVVWTSRCEIALKGDEKDEVLAQIADMEPDEVRNGAKVYRFLDSRLRITVIRVYESGKVTKEVAVLKKYLVWNILDCEGIPMPKKEKTNKENEPKPFDAIAAGDALIEAYVKGSGLHGLFNDQADRAFYRPSADEIHLPKKPQFKNSAEYYSTAFHEMTHSTGHQSRLAREFGGWFGSDKYAKEELIAETGASMLMGYLGIATEGTMLNSAAYLKSWAEHIKGSKELADKVIAACSDSRKAFAYIATIYEASLADAKGKEKTKESEKPAPMPIPSANAERYEQLTLFRDVSDVINTTTSDVEPVEGDLAWVEDGEIRFPLYLENNENEDRDDLPIRMVMVSSPAISVDEFLRRIDGGEMIAEIEASCEQTVMDGEGWDEERVFREFANLGAMYGYANAPVMKVSDFLQMAKDGKLENGVYFLTNHDLTPFIPQPPIKVETRVTDVMGMTCDCVEISGTFGFGQAFRDLAAIVSDEDKVTVILRTQYGIECETFEGTGMNREFEPEDGKKILAWFLERYPLAKTEKFKLRALFLKGEHTVKDEAERKAHAIADRVENEELLNIRGGILQCAALFKESGHGDMAEKIRGEERVYARAMGIQQIRVNEGTDLWGTGR